MGNTIISVGTRHVKLWRLDEGIVTSPVKNGTEVPRKTDRVPQLQGPKVLQGRNCILGSMADGCFTSVTTISSDQALIGTAEGDLCLLEASDELCSLKRIQVLPFEISAVSVDQQCQNVAVGGKGGFFVTFALRPFLSGNLIDENSISRIIGSDILAVGYQADIPMIVGADHSIIVDPEERAQMPTIPVHEHELSNGMDFNGSVHSVNSKLEESEKPFCAKIKPIERYAAGITEGCYLSSHSSSVLGIQALHKMNKFSSDFLTFSSDGTVIFWTIDGQRRHQRKLHLLPASNNEDGKPNEVKALRASESGEAIIYGDALGTLMLVGPKTSSVKAHSAEVIAIALCQSKPGFDLVASCGRDRVIQIFRSQDCALDLLQTLSSEHTAAIICLAFNCDASYLITASADRTIVLRSAVSGGDDRLVYVQTGLINLKASPLVAFINFPNTVIVSTMDRQVTSYDLETGQLLESFKSAEGPGTTESVVLNICRFFEVKNKYTSNSAFIVGTSSTDKSIRLYDPSNGALLAKEYGQMAVGDLAVIKYTDGRGIQRYRVVTANLNGTIYIWKLNHPSSPFDDLPNNANGSELAKSVQPLRKVLSKTETRELQKTLETSSAPTTPINRDHFPIRMRKKTSRLGLSHAPRQTLSAIHSLSYQESSKSVVDSPSLTVLRSARALKSQTESIDSEDSEKAVACLSTNVNEMAEELCASLRAVRSEPQNVLNELSSSVQADLVHELHQMMAILTKGKTNSENTLSKEHSVDGSFDDYLAKMIDKRLALRNISDNHDVEQICTCAGSAERDAVIVNGSKENG